MQKSKINWTKFARIAPNDPATGEDYRGQSLKRVAEGLRENVMLYKWLQGNGISCAKTKKGRYRSGRRVETRHEKQPVLSKQLADINKAIEGSLSS